MKEKLPRTLGSHQIQHWCSCLENPETPHAHGLLYHLLESFSQSNRGFSWLRQHCLPFLDVADETLGRIAHQWGDDDSEFPPDATQLSEQCLELAKFCDRYVIT